MHCIFLICNGKLLVVEVSHDDETQYVTAQHPTLRPSDSVCFV